MKKGLKKILILKNDLENKIISSIYYIRIDNYLFYVKDWDSNINQFSDLLECMSKKPLNSFKMYLLQYPLTKADTLLMMAIAYFVRSIFYLKEKKNYDITFFYSFPLHDEIHLLNCMLTCLGDIVDNNLIIFDASDNFLKVSISQEAFQKCMKDDCLYLIRRNRKDVYIDTRSDLYELLMNWRNFCRQRFKKIYNKRIINIYMQLFSQEGFFPITYYCNGDIMAQEILYKSPKSKTNYICIFIWNKNYKHRSPGKYAYALSIVECKKEKRYFSYCYGNQNYKKKWMKSFLIDDINTKLM